MNFLFSNGKKHLTIYCCYFLSLICLPFIKALFIFLEKKEKKQTTPLYSLVNAVNSKWRTCVQILLKVIEADGYLVFFVVVVSVSSCSTIYFMQRNMHKWDLTLAISKRTEVEWWDAFGEAEFCCKIVLFIPQELSV